MSDSISTWAEGDRPREKFINMGARTVSDAELLAIIIGSGTQENSALSLARKVIKASDGNLHTLASRSINDLCEIKGIGTAKAITILSAMELAGRRWKQALPKRTQVRHSADVYEELRMNMAYLDVEEFWVVCLNRANHILSKQRISQGGISGTVADPKVIFEKALSEKASGIVLAHNHPSGNLNPSQADIDLTKRLRKGGELLDLPVIDHLIVTSSGYFSFADEGIL